MCVCVGVWVCGCDVIKIGVCVMLNYKDECVCLCVYVCVCLFVCVCVML